MQVTLDSHDGAAEVAADSDTLILVDQADNEVGHMSKSPCHDGHGGLHRAFSILIFNERRAAAAAARAVEAIVAALLVEQLLQPSAARRDHGGGDSPAAAEELGLACPLSFLFKFQYQAQFEAAGAEHEVCSVFIGRTADPVGSTAARSRVTAGSARRRCRRNSAAMRPVGSLHGLYWNGAGSGAIIAAVSPCAPLHRSHEPGHSADPSLPCGRPTLPGASCAV